MKRLIFLAPLALFLVVAAYFLAGLGRDPQMLPSALISSPVPDFALPPLEGRAAAPADDSGLASADLRTGEPQIVNVWASWCAPCRVEHPLITALATEHGIAVNGINYKNAPDQAAAFLAELGDAYVSAMELAGEYAYAGRDTVVTQVLEILGAEAVREVHNHHNFAWREEHFGRTYWVVRKGCTPARPGQEGFVGGSMGDESVILEGLESEDAVDSLYSTVHGAGRVMSRSKAAGRIRRGRQVKPGVVDWPAVQARLREQGIVLVGGGADEAPEVYKRLPDVLAAHAGSVRVKHRLRPLGVAMAGRDVYDPYKD